MPVGKPSSKDAPSIKRNLYTKTFSKAGYLTVLSALLWAGSRSKLKKAGRRVNTENVLYGRK